MKRLKYLAFLMVVSVIGLTSCKDDNDGPKEPSITLDSTAGYAINGSEFMVGDTAVFGVRAAWNQDSKEKLVKFTMERIHENVPVTLIDSTLDKVETFRLNISSVMTNAGDYNFRFKVIDKAGEFTSLDAKVTVKEATTGLSAPADFEWMRVAGAPGTGLEMFGLKWTSNAKAVHAQIKKDGATKFVKLASDACATITTAEGLMAAIDAAEDMEVYAGVSAEANGDYDDVLATVKDGVYYMISVKKGTVETSAAGTTIKITGKYKSTDLPIDVK